MKGFMSKKRGGGKIGSYSSASGKAGTPSKGSTAKTILDAPVKDKQVMPAAKAKQSR